MPKPGAQLAAGGDLLQPEVNVRPLFGEPARPESLHQHTGAITWLRLVVDALQCDHHSLLCHVLPPRLRCCCVARDLHSCRLIGYGRPPGGMPGKSLERKRRCFSHSVRWSCLVFLSQAHRHTIYSLRGSVTRKSRGRARCPSQTSHNKPRGIAQIATIPGGRESKNDVLVECV